MPIQASTVLDRVRFTLQDVNKHGWSDNELLAHLNAGVTQLAGLKPDINPFTSFVSLDPGVIQELPTGGLILLDGLYNGAHQSVTMKPLHEYAKVNPGWAGDDEGPTRFLLYDVRLPRQFFVYPPASSGRGVWIIYGAEVGTFANVNDTLNGLRATWVNALWAFTVASAYAKNSSRQNLAKSAQFMSMFVQLVTGNTQAMHATATPEADLK